MWFDTHCHLYDLEEHEPLQDVVGRARAADVEMLVVGVDAATSERARALAAEFGLWAGAAWHPSAMRGWRDEWIDAIEGLLNDDRVVAVGETGLDFYWDRSYVDDQIRGFAAHIDLSKRHDKALVVHTRESFDRAADALEAEGPPARLVFHCWSGDRAQLDRALALGAFISFAGNVSYKKNEGLREVVATVPSDRLLLETDSPYLTPVPQRGKRNEPAFVRHVGEAVAAARGIGIEELASIATSNGRRVFGIDDV